MYSAIPALMISRRAASSFTLITNDFKISTTNATSHSFTSLRANSFIAVCIAQPDDGIVSTVSISITSTPSLTWSLQKSTYAVASSGNTWIYTAFFTAGGNITVNVSATVSGGNTDLTSCAYVFSGEELTYSGATNSATNQTAANISFTTTKVGSYVLCVSSDWSATNGARTYRFTEAVETGYSNVAGKYTAIFYYYLVSSVGTNALGYTAPVAGANVGTSMIEVRSA